MAVILKFPDMAKDSTFVEWFERVGTEQEIQEYREYLNRITMHKIINLNTWRKNNAVSISK